VFPERQKGWEMTKFDSMIIECEERIKELAGDAQEVANEHWRFHYRENAGRPPREKGRLNVWVRARKGGLEISWTHFRFVKHAGAVSSRPKSIHITKGRGNKYRAHSLTVRAKDWEIDQVLETEEKLAEIRAEYASVRKIITYAKEVNKKAAKRLGQPRKESGNQEVLGGEVA